MDRLIAANSVNLAGADGPPGSGTPQYATDGNAGLGVPATRWPAYQYNAIQEEIMNVLIAAGITPSKANNAQLLLAVSTGRLSRTRLTANTTYYVNASTGNNSNTGLSSGQAWLTLAFAMAYLQANIDFAGFTLTLELAGNFTTTLNVQNQWVGNSGSALFVINSSTAASISAASGNGISVTGANVQIQGAITIASSAANGIVSSSGASVNIGAGLIFGACALAQISADTGNVFIVGNYSISGNANNHITALHGSTLIYSGGLTVTATGGTRTFSTFAACSQCSLIDAQSGSNPTFSGTYVGARYSASVNGVFVGTAGGASVFPGNSAGTTATGGQYT